MLEIYAYSGFYTECISASYATRLIVSCVIPHIIEIDENFSV